MSADLPAGMADPFEANIASLLAHYGGIPGGEIADTPAVRVSTTNQASRTLNAASVAILPADKQFLIRTTIAATLDFFARRGQPWRWIVGSTSQPDGLGHELVAAGLVLGAEVPTMSLSLDGRLPDPDGPAGLDVREVEEAASFEAWIEVQRSGLKFPPRAAEAWEAVHRALGWGRGLPLRNYVGLIGDRPVGAAALYLGGVAGGEDVAGIYNVATIPEARGMGIARALTLAALRDGQAAGRHVASLGSSPMGLSVYHRLGFVEVGRLRWYTTPEWR